MQAQSKHSNTEEVINGQVTATSGRAAVNTSCPCLCSFACSKALRGDAVRGLNRTFEETGLVADPDLHGGASSTVTGHVLTIR